MVADWIDRSKSATSPLTLVAFYARGLLRSGPLASDDELHKFAGSFALESIEFLDMARGDFHQSL